MSAPKISSVPVLLTEDNFAEDVEESRNARMNEHISKPLDIAKVKATIVRYINRKNHNTEFFKIEI